MRKFLASLLVGAMAVALTLSFVILLIEADIHISRIANPVLHAVAVIAELFIGIAGLLGTVFLSTRLAVRIFRKAMPPRA